MLADRPVFVAILTVSDTRTMQDDIGGGLVEQFSRDAGFRVADREIVRDEPPLIRERMCRWLGDPCVDAILSTGGTGIARRDTTIEVVRGLMTVELEGFGELFRMLSWQEVGAAAMLSRAVAGLTCHGDDAGGDTFLFAMPGSANAVQTAMKQLIVPQLPHLVWERSR